MNKNKKKNKKLTNGNKTGKKNNKKKVNLLEINRDKLLLKITKNPIQI
jgi:hypothetical protein